MIKPFADDASTSTIGDLAIENGTAAVVVSGSLEVTRDKAGLKRAHELKRLADELVTQLEAEGDLPDRVERKTEPDGSGEIANPFA